MLNKKFYLIAFTLLFASTSITKARASDPFKPTNFDFVETKCKLQFVPVPEDSKVKEIWFISRNGQRDFIGRSSLRLLSIPIQYMKVDGTLRAGPAKISRSVVFNVDNQIVWINEDGRTAVIDIPPSSIVSISFTVLEPDTESKSTSKIEELANFYEEGLFYRISFQTKNQKIERKFIIRSSDGSMIEKIDTVPEKQFVGKESLLTMEDSALWSRTGDFEVGRESPEGAKILVKHFPPPPQKVSNAEMILNRSSHPGYDTEELIFNAEHNSNLETTAQKDAREFRMEYVRLYAVDFTSEGRGALHVRDELKWDLSHNTLVDIIFDSERLTGEALYQFNYLQKNYKSILKNEVINRVFISDLKGRSAPLSDPCELSLAELSDSERLR